MGPSRTRLAESLGWAGSLSLHAALWLSAAGVIPLAQGLHAMADTLRPDETRRAETPPIPVPPPPQPPAGQPKPVEVRLPEPPPPEPPEPQEITLGIDESTATDIDTWLGFADPTPHHGGMPLGYEQAQLDRAPGERSANLDLESGLGATDAPSGAPSQTERTSNPSDAPLHGEDGADDSTRDAFVAAQTLPTITLAPAEQRSDAPGAGAAREIARQTSDIIARAREALDAMRAGGAAGGRPVDETAKPPAEAEPLDESGAGGDETTLGFLSDRDSDAAAIEQAVSINPGKPLAAKGLRIQTVRPRWSVYALATANPNDVVVRIWFDGQGRVTEAKIIQSSGRNDVDRPILDAVYNWRATGEQLRKVRDRPDGRVQLVFRIDLER